MCKEKVIRFRIEEDYKKKFEKWCQQHDTDPSKELRKFVFNICQWFDEYERRFVIVDSDGEYYCDDVDSLGISP